MRIVARLHLGCQEEREDTRNLIIGSAAPELIHMAELTAAAFRTARVPPLLGRGLLDSDDSREHRA